MTKLTPAVLAQLDQEKAELDRHLNVLIETYRRMAAKAGPVQATANLTAFAPTSYDEGSVAALLAIAIQRLVDGGAA